MSVRGHVGGAIFLLGLGCGAARPASPSAPHERTAPMLGPYASLDAFCGDEGPFADAEEGGLEDESIALSCAPLRDEETATGSTGAIARAGVLRLTELGADRCRAFVDLVGGRTWIADASVVCEARDLDPERTLTRVAEARTTIEDTAVSIALELDGQSAGSYETSCRRNGPEWRCTDWLPTPGPEPTP